MKQKSIPPSDSEIYGDYQDYQEFASQLKKIGKKHNFTDDFLNFMDWFKKDIHSRYTKKDFQRMELKNFQILFFGFLGILAAYLVLHTYVPGFALLWGIPLFIVGILVYKKGEVMHMRTHSPANLTGVQALDKFIDYAGLGFSGFSPGLFGRRHMAAHYNDIGILSKIFSELNISFDKVPASFYLRPQLLIKYLFDKKFLKEEHINGRTLAVETIGFYCYMGLMVAELFFGSYFLLVFHLLPGLVLAASQFISATLVHSSSDPHNSWEANGLMDHRTATGLFRVPLWWFSLFNHGFLQNHGIHHAYPQVPLDLINADYQRYHRYILEHYSNVRYNRTMAHDVQADLLARLGPPNPFDYFVAWLISVGSMFVMLLTIMGLPIAPGVLELALVDWRVYTVSKRSERIRNRLTYMDSLNFVERYQSTPNPNTYLKWMFWRYNNWKKYVAAH